MAINGLGKETITKLHSLNIISDILSIYNINPSKLKSIKGFEGKKGDDLLISIENSRNIECWQFIGGLGIPNFGEVNSKIICNNFGNNFINSNFNDLIVIDGLGEEKASYFHQFLHINKEYIHKLLEKITLINCKKIEAKENNFKGKTIVLTGTMSVSRGDIKKMLEDMGAKIASSVSKKTDYVIYGEDAGSKYDKAIELNVKILTEDEMNQLI